MTHFPITFAVNSTARPGAGHSAEEVTEMVSYLIAIVIVFVSPLAVPVRPRSSTPSAIGGDAPWTRARNVPPRSAPSAQPSAPPVPLWSQPKRDAPRALSHRGGGRNTLRARWRTLNVACSCKPSTSPSRATAVGPSSEVKLNSASMVLVIERAAGEPAEHDRRHDAELAQ